MNNIEDGSEGAWSCTRCGQVNAGWANECGRCEAPRDTGDSSVRESLFATAQTKACVSQNGKPSVAIIAEGDVYVYVISPKNALALAMGLIEAAHNSVTNTMLFNTMVERGMSDAAAAAAVTEFSKRRHALLTENNPPEPPGDGPPRRGGV